MGVSIEKFISDGSRVEFVTANDMQSKSHMRVDVYTTGDTDVFDYQLSSTLYDVFGLNILLLREAIPTGKTLYVSISSDGNGLDTEPTAYEDILENMNAINSVYEVVDYIPSVASVTTEIETIGSDSDLITSIKDAESNANIATLKALEASVSASSALSSKELALSYKNTTELLKTQVSDIADSIHELNVEQVSSDESVSYNATTNTLNIPQGLTGAKGDKPILSIDNEGNLIVSYEDDIDYNTVGVY